MVRSRARPTVGEVVSAVYLLHNRCNSGVDLASVAQYMVQKHDSTRNSELKQSLKLAVNEGFLNVKRNRFFPTLTRNHLTAMSPVMVARRPKQSRRRNQVGFSGILGSRRKGRRHDVGTALLLEAARRGRSARRVGWALKARRRKSQRGNNKIFDIEIDDMLEARRRRRTRKRGRRHSIDAGLGLLKARRRRRSRRRRGRRYNIEAALLLGARQHRSRRRRRRSRYVDLVELTQARRRKSKLRKSKFEEKDRVAKAPRRRSPHRQRKELQTDTTQGKNESQHPNPKNENEIPQETYGN